MEQWRKLAVSVAETDGGVFPMMRLLAISGAFAALMSTSAQAQEAEVTIDLNMRAGPGARYPIITTIPEGRSVEVYGCLSDYDWCDVGWRGNRGWVFTDYLEYYYRNQPRPVIEWGPRIGLPIVTFSFGEYARRYYRDMPWYDDRDRWSRWDRDRRDRRNDYRYDDDDDDNVRYRVRNRDFDDEANDDDYDGGARTIRRYQTDDDAPARGSVTPDSETEASTGGEDNDDATNMRRRPRGERMNEAMQGNRPARCNPARENCAPGRSQTQGNSTTSDDNNSQQRTDD
jgi:uncharacterized protein YraI